MDSINEIKAYIEEQLKPSRLTHTYNVRDEAMRLARLYGEDEQKAELAALCHDMAKYVLGDELKAEVARLGLDEIYTEKPNLAHSKLGAAYMRERFGIVDEDVLNAVRYHTTGRAGMSLLEKIVYIADLIEPDRDYPDVAEIRRLADTDIDAACLFSLKSSEAYVNECGLYLDPDTHRAIEWLETEKHREEIK